MRKVKPVSPDEVDFKRNIPDIVVKAFNTLIKKYWDGRQAIVKQPVVIDEIMKGFRDAGAPIERQVIWDEHYLDVEPLFRKAGWKVMYDKPAMDDNYDAYWKFQK